jgi:MarR family transcriptional regulator, organic hydroperoxide resistance regulator
LGERLKTRDDEDLELFLLLNRVYYMLHRVRSEETLVFKILPPQVYILRIIQTLGKDATPTEISKYVYRVKSSVSDILSRMEKQGLITKNKESDKTKRVIIKMTDKGKKTLELTRETGRINKILSSLDDKEKRQLHSLLQKLFDSVIAELNSSSGKKLSPAP